MVPDVVVSSILVAFQNGPQRVITYKLELKKEAGGLRGGLTLFRALKWAAYNGFPQG
jgi:hypothetical protein